MTEIRITIFQGQAVNVCYFSLDVKASSSVMGRGNGLNGGPSLPLPKRYVHLEPINLTPFGIRVFADVIKVSR